MTMKKRKKPARKAVRPGRKKKWVTPRLEKHGVLSIVEGD